MVNRVNFERSVSWKPLQTSISLGLLGLVLSILHIHVLPQLDVRSIFLQVFLVVILGVFFLELQNFLRSLTEGVVVNVLQCIHEGFRELCAS